MVWSGKVWVKWYKISTIKQTIRTQIIRLKMIAGGETDIDIESFAKALTYPVAELHTVI